jgi:uncharacterized membrane protein YfcA
MSPAVILYGAVVGLSLGLTGGGGAIFAVPLLVYGLGVDPREAVGASLVTVGATALVGFLQRWRVGLVELRTGLLFAVAGMATAPLGSWLATQVPETLLMVLFALLMLVVAVRMWRKAEDSAERHVLIVAADESGPVCRRDPQGELHWNSRCAMLLVAAGLGTGLLTGLFGVGGGFIIVPALVLLSGMGMQRAVGTSLLVIALVSMSGTASLIATGRAVPWSIVGWFVTGSLIGLGIGSRLASLIGGPKLQRVFAVAILFVAVFVITRNLAF